MDITLDPTTLAAAYTENESPRNQFSVRSYLQLTKQVQWDNMLYYVSEVTQPIEPYLRYDSRLGWKVTPGVEVSLIGRKLLDSRHREFTYFPQAEIERSVLGILAVRF